MKAYLKDRFGVVITVIVPFNPEELYILYKAAERGANITILCTANKRKIRLDIRSLDADRTFSESILAAHESTIPPPPALPEEMSVWHDTLPSER